MNSPTVCRSLPAIVSLPDSDPRHAGSPEKLFTTGLVPSDAIDQYATIDSGFILRIAVSAGPDAGAVQVVVNWTSLVPAK